MIELFFILHTPLLHDTHDLLTPENVSYFSLLLFLIAILLYAFDAILFRNKLSFWLMIVISVGTTVLIAYEMKAISFDFLFS